MGNYGVRMDFAVVFEEGTHLGGNCVEGGDVPWF